MLKNKTLIAALLTCSLATAAHATQPQYIGSQIKSLIPTGYGLYAVTMKPSSEAGAVSSFFLFDSQGAWPKRWHEVDLEFVPGYVASKTPSIARYLVDNSAGAQNCFGTPSSLSQCSPENITTSSTPMSSEMSFNTYGNDSLVMNETNPAAQNQPVIIDKNSGHQVFYKPQASIYTQPYTYFIYYTPTGLYWSKPTTTTFGNSLPSTLPTPVFEKVSPTAASTAPNANAAYVLTANQSQFAPTLPNSTTLAPGGAPLYMYFNIWDGSNNQSNYWGGPTPPTANTSASYQAVAFYPMQGTSVATAGADANNPLNYKYGNAEIYSNFTNGGSFDLNGNVVTFNQLWNVSDTTKVPLGTLSQWNVSCSTSGVTLNLTQGYAAVSGDYGKDNTTTNCSWFDEAPSVKKLKS